MDSASLKVIFKTLDGKTFAVSSSLYLLHQMNEVSIANRQDSVVAYMVKTAKACKLYNGSHIFTHNREAFFASLVGNGFLKIEGFSKPNSTLVELATVLGSFGLQINFTGGKPIVSHTLVGTVTKTDIHLVFEQFANIFQQKILLPA